MIYKYEVNVKLKANGVSVHANIEDLIILWQDQIHLSFLTEVFVFLPLLHMSLCLWR